jgi:hypothetical protein
MGAISQLAAEAARPFTSAAAVATSPAEPEPGSAAGGDLGAAMAGSFSAEYAMALLATVTRAGADQALTLIQMMRPNRSGR